MSTTHSVSEARTEHTRYARRVYDTEQCSKVKLIVITRCPACEAKIPPDGYEAFPSHLRTHDPEDFGLSPLEDDG